MWPFDSSFLPAEISTRPYQLYSEVVHRIKVEDPQPTPAPKENPTVRILPFKDQDSPDLVRKQLKDLRLKTHTVIQPAFVSDETQRELKVYEIKPPIVNQQCVIYKF